MLEVANPFLESEKHRAFQQIPVAPWIGALAALEVLGNIVGEFLRSRVDGQDTVLQHLELSLEAIAKVADDSRGLSTEVLEPSSDGLREGVHSGVQQFFENRGPVARRGRGAGGVRGLSRVDTAHELLSESVAFLGLDLDEAGSDLAVLAEEFR